jgi:hypothetical protein
VLDVGCENGSIVQLGQGADYYDHVISQKSAYV